MSGLWVRLGKLKAEWLRVGGGSMLDPRFQAASRLNLPLPGTTVDDAWTPMAEEQHQDDYFSLLMDEGIDGISL
jgi:hypothetical protein